VIANGKEATLVAPEGPRISATLGEGSVEHASRSTLGGVRPPVVIVKLPVIDAAGAPAHRCDVRLVRSARTPTDDDGGDADAGQVTAVVILRDATPSRVMRCVRAATRGAGSISTELLGQLLPVAERARREPSEPQLTDREYEVLRMLADGESTRGIAERLSYSERTVKNIVRDLLVKLNCKTRAHAVALAVRQGVI
jgi:DNA-binding CsgD family transcriptional regulator